MNNTLNINNNSTFCNININSNTNTNSNSNSNTNNNNNNNIYKINNNKCPLTSYSLQGSQPYILTYNWPNGFILPCTKFEADYSLYNLETYNTTHKYAVYNCK